MKRIVLSGVVAWCMLGCVNELPAVNDGPQMVFANYLSEPAPATLPLVPLVAPQRNPIVLPAGNSAHQILNSQPELDAFLMRITTPPPSGVPSAKPASRPAPLPAVDFSKYQVVAFADVSPPGTDSARIVGIKEQADTRIVHTVRWVKEGAGSVPVTPGASLHMVALARSEKPLLFAHTRTSVLTVAPVRPSPQVGVPWEPGPDQDPDELPRWRTIPNPEVTETTVEATARDMLKELAVTSLTVERRTIAWAVEQLQVGERDNWLPDSEVWVVKAEGGPTRLGPDGLSRVPVSGVSPRLVSLLFSIEDGMPLVSIGL